MKDKLRMTPELMKAARALISWSQRDLADNSGVSLPTIQRMEKEGVGRSSFANVQKVQGAFDMGGVLFIPENGGGPGVRLKGKD